MGRQCGAAAGQPRACCDGIQTDQGQTLAILLRAQLADIPAIEGWAYTLPAAPDGQHALVGGEGGQLKVVEIPALSR